MATPKKDRKFPMVEFSAPELFEGAIQLPNTNYLPFGVQRNITGKNPDLNKLAEFIGEHGGEGAQEVLDSLVGEDEIEEFFTKWAEADTLPAPKSSK